MPAPNTNRGTLKIDKRLTNFSLKYMNGNMVADAICPMVDVKNESDKYMTYGREDQRINSDLRADKAPVNYIPSVTGSDATYTCVERALGDYVSDRERRNTDAPMNLDIDVNENLTNMLMLGREKRVADLVTTTANIPASNRVTLSGTEQWNNASFDSDSLDDAIRVRFDTGREAIRQSIGKDPNTVIIPSAVAKVIYRDASIVDLVKHTDPSLLIKSMLPPELWDMKVHIAGSIYASNNEGQDFSGADVWGKNVVMAYVAPQPKSTKVMTAALTFVAKKRNTVKYREDKLAADAIEVSWCLVDKLVATSAIYLIKNCIA